MERQKVTFTICFLKLNIFIMEEIWKDIEGYEGIYQVSNLGNVKTIYDNTHHKKVDRLLKQKFLKTGYKIVALSKMCKRKYFTVHRLVAKAFIPNTCNLPSINHKDENKSNNNVSNLEWCTIAYNNTYGSHATCNNKPVLFMKGDKVINKFDSVIEASTCLNVDRTTISKILHHKLKSWKGFTFAEYKK